MASNVLEDAEMDSAETPEIYTLQFYFLSLI